MPLLIPMASVFSPTTGGSTFVSYPAIGSSATSALGSFGYFFGALTTTGYPFYNLFGSFSLTSSGPAYVTLCPSFSAILA